MSSPASEYSAIVTHASTAVACCQMDSRIRAMPTDRIKDLLLRAVAISLGATAGWEHAAEKLYTLADEFATMAPRKGG